MGVQPQLTHLHVHEAPTFRKRALGSIHHTVRRHRHPETPAETLPKEAQQLKEKILRTHGAKRTRFSLSHMKKRVMPPVEIPRAMGSQRALTTTVSGRSVPLTRCMWDNTKRKTHHMEQIPELYPLRCTLFR
ncbi:hypothetical protein CCR75_007922 [Bremia lactucae]|uniref:Uncharacterized protein n=1 Tax=Bremia lactucae TaxID=4779 RepID=A0A976FQU7_BRELC|nr:hypothetical protein CCR75_007922 [Bremia lactucae]